MKNKNLTDKTKWHLSLPEHSSVLYMRCFSKFLYFHTHIRVIGYTAHLMKCHFPSFDRLILYVVELVTAASVSVCMIELPIL